MYGSRGKVVTVKIQTASTNKAKVFEKRWIWGRWEAGYLCGRTVNAYKLTVAKTALKVSFFAPKTG